MEKPAPRALFDELINEPVGIAADAAKQPAIKELLFTEIVEKFPDEQAAIDYIAGILWKDGAVCPHCGSKNVKERKSRKNFHHCNACQKDFTIRVGTIFEGSHLPLHKWLYTMYLMVMARKGISAMQLSKVLGVTYKTAWFVEHRIRKACGNQKKNS